MDGKQLRFRNEEVTVAIQKDQAVPYQILQTLYRPLTNEFGQSIPQDAFIMFSPSNPVGTLRTELETPVPMGQRQIYTSNGAGDEDEFVLVYNARVPESQPGGVYHTQMTLSLEPIQGQAGLSPSIVTLDVRLDIESSFDLKVQSQSGARILDLGRLGERGATTPKPLILTIDSNAAGRYQVFLQWIEPMISEKGVRLDPSALQILLQGGKNGTIASLGPNPSLNDSEAWIYRSDEWGSRDEIELGMGLAPEAHMQAGTYQGAILLRAESGSPVPPPAPVTVPVRLEVDPVIGLETVIEGGGALSFGTFRADSGRSERRVQLKVTSNLEQPYQISQIVSRKMSNESGKAVPEDAFQFRAQRATSGSVLTGVYEPVREGEVVVYRSDDKGTPEDLLLEYFLEMPSNAAAGAYSTELSYSITAL